MGADCIRQAAQSCGVGCGYLQAAPRRHVEKHPNLGPINTLTCPADLQAMAGGCEEPRHGLPSRLQSPGLDARHG
jgi:hypothetical protein